MVRSTDWAQLAHVGEVLQRYRVLALTETAYREPSLLSRMREAREALWKQLMEDFGLANKRQLVGCILVYEEWEISKEAIELLNDLCAALHEAERLQADQERRATRAS